MKRLIVTLAMAVSCSIAFSQVRLPQQIRIEASKHSVELSNGDASSAFGLTFRIFRAEEDPMMELKTIPNCRYFAPSWVVKGLDESKRVKAVKWDASHGGDGIDHSVDNIVADRTFDVFKSAPSVVLEPRKMIRHRDTTIYVYPKCEWGALKCRIWPNKDSAPTLEYSFTPSCQGYYSVCYEGAPQAEPRDVDEMWQPMVWQKKLFPEQPYLTLAFNCPIPAALAMKDGVTIGVAVDSEEIPFQPLLTRDNNRFGVAVMNGSGNVQPTVFAPVLGHIESYMESDVEYAFSLRLWVERNKISDVFQTIARNLYDFHDYRRNDICSLNTTIDNIIEYTLGGYSNFLDSLKGCSYSTDVPGSVKNVSSLNPLGTAVISDDEELYKKRAYPIIEFMLSRQNSLFCLDTAQKVQKPSRAMGGPCASLSELASLYLMSGKKSGALKSLLDLKASSSFIAWYDELELYRATGDEKYLKDACKKADQYIDQYEKTMRKKNFRSAFFWTSHVLRYVNLWELYEITGETRYLDAAYEGARNYAMFVWMIPQIPEGTDVLVNKDNLAPWYWYLKGKGFSRQSCPEEYAPASRLSEIGLVSESSTTGIGHRGVFMAFHAPYFMRIAKAKDDSFLYDIARSAIVGRYANFPGYHINTERTTAYEKADYPLRPHDSLSVNSFHYNHPFPFLNMLYDYLLTDFAYKTDGAIRFPSSYIEGYAYLQSRFYGLEPGNFYNRGHVWLWMPRHLVDSGNVELNYICARGENELLVAFSNQSCSAQSATVRFNTALVPQMEGRTLETEIWKNNEFFGSGCIVDGKCDVSVEASSVYAIVIKDVRIVPTFQSRFVESARTGWKNDHADIPFGRSSAYMLDFGDGLKTAYVYLRDDESKIRDVKLSYSIDDGETIILNDSSYPYEFSIALPDNASSIEFVLSGTSSEGQDITSDPFILSKYL